jgi:hypothetical protein
VSRALEPAAVAHAGVVLDAEARVTLSLALAVDDHATDARVDGRAAVAAGAREDQGETAREQPEEEPCVAQDGTASPSPNVMRHERLQKRGPRALGKNAEESHLS